MWKSITRGIRESLERRVCRTNVYSQPSNDECSGSEAKPSVDVKKSCLTACRYTSGFCGFFNYRGTRDKRTNPNWTTDRTLCDVLGWSGILAIGWAICQTPCIRKHIFERKRNDNWSHDLLKCPKTQVSYVLKHALSLQPKHVLPVTNCVGTGRQLEDSGHFEKRPYGPITVEEALDAARNEYSRTHKIVMGEFELRYGMRALEEKRYKDAMDHFLIGAQLASPGSMFNLGLCHELGIGTRIDPVKAVKYYQSAAESGHAGAMYNLGVFHAQGRGGLPINLGEARDLFTRAAMLGQAEAQTALKLEREMQQNVQNENNEHVPSTLVEKSNDCCSYIGDGDFVASDTSSTSLDSDYNSLYSSDTMLNPTQAFLDFLGVQTSQVLMESAK